VLVVVLYPRGHGGPLEVAISNLKVTLLGHLVGDFQDKKLKKIEDKWMVNMGTLFVGANTRNEVLSNNRKNYRGS
jgi:hypothetical protein